MIAVLLIGVAVLSALLGFAIGRSGGPQHDQTQAVTVVGEEVALGRSLAGTVPSLLVDGFPQHTDVGERAMAISVV